MPSVGWIKLEEAVHRRDPNLMRAIRQHSVDARHRPLGSCQRLRIDPGQVAIRASHPYGAVRTDLQRSRVGNLQARRSPLLGRVSARWDPTQAQIPCRSRACLRDLESRPKQGCRQCRRQLCNPPTDLPQPSASSPWPTTPIQIDPSRSTNRCLEFKGRQAISLGNDTPMVLLPKCEVGPLRCQNAAVHVFSQRGERFRFENPRNIPELEAASIGNQLAHVQAAAKPDVPVTGDHHIQPLLFRQPENGTHLR